MEINQNKPFPELMAIFAWLHEEIEADGSSGKVSSRLERAEEKKGPPPRSAHLIRQRRFMWTFASAVCQWGDSTSISLFHFRR